jgi:cytochrome c oxidase subunit 2
MSSPLRSPEGTWWDVPIHGQERTWIGLVGITCVILFGWMVGWMFVGNQNPRGDTNRTTPDAYRAKMAAYKEEGTATNLGLIPAGDDIFVAGIQFAWDGLPVVLEAGHDYRLHLSSYDVQHGFSVRQEDELWKQINLQVVPGYEWVIPIRFDEPGTYHVVCNEFCGLGHQAMQGVLYVVAPGQMPASGQGG